MAQLIATINGKPVYSDKRMTGIVNTRINFADGSWCDVATGEVINRGPGFISIGAQPSSSAGTGEQVTVGPKSFKNTFLQIKGIAADVEILAAEQDGITVSMSGDKATIEAITFRTEGNTLILEPKEASSKQSQNTRNVFNNVFQGSMQGVVITGNSSNISINSGGGNRAQDAKVTITVPRLTPVTVIGVMGDVLIGDTEAALHAQVLAHNLTAGKVGAADLDVIGSGDIRVAQVNGLLLSCKIMGSGDIVVKDGSVSSLKAQVMGSGDINYGGRADYADLTVMGSGDITVNKVTNKPNKAIMGTGDIKIVSN